MIEDNMPSDGAQGNVTNGLDTLTVGASERVISAQERPKDQHEKAEETVLKVEEYLKGMIEKPDLTKILNGTEGRRSKEPFVDIEGAYVPSISNILREPSGDPDEQSDELRYVMRDTPGIGYGKLEDFPGVNNVDNEAVFEGFKAARQELVGIFTNPNSTLRDMATAYADFVRTQCYDLNAAHAVLETRQTAA